MSEVVSNEFVEEVIPEAETEGQIAEAIEEIESLSEREIELLPVDEYGDKYVAVQVNGEEVRVPLKEALAGYQRQADYTRKTQERSEQRKQAHFGVALQQALEEDPSGTLQMLQEHYGAAQPSEDDEWLDPAELHLRQLEQRISSFEQAKAMEDLQRTVDSLQTKYGDEFDPEEVVAKALAQGSSDLEAVFKQIAFDKVYAQAQVGKKKLVEESTRTQAKREAAIVSSGNSAKTTTPIKSDAPKSVYEAYEAAKRQLNLN